jgi:hypothetical protein
MASLVNWQVFWVCGPWKKVEAREGGCFWLEILGADAGRSSTSLLQLPGPRCPRATAPPLPLPWSRPPGRDDEREQPRTPIRASDSRFGADGLETGQRGPVTGAGSLKRVGRCGTANPRPLTRNSTEARSWLVGRQASARSLSGYKKKSVPASCVDVGRGRIWPCQTGNRVTCGHS